MAYKARQWKAIDYYMKANSLKVTLSAAPFLTFIKPDGSKEDIHISSIEDSYEAYLQRSKKEKASATRKTKKASK